MGAYENPPLIQTPNYGEIIARNVQNIMAIINQRKEEEKTQTKEKESKFLAAGEKKTDFAKRAGSIKAGGLTSDINDYAFKLVDKNSLNEDAFAKGDISAEEYANNKALYEQSLMKLSNTGTAVREFATAIKDMDLSAYQENASIIGLVEAYKNGAISVEEVDGSHELHYMIGDQKMVVDESMLGDPNTWSVVEKFDSDDITTDLAKIVENQINQEVTSIATTDDGRLTTSEERYSQAYGTEEKRMNQIMQNKVVAGLDKQELGSYYMDSVSANINAENDVDLNAVLDAQNLTDEQKSQIKQDVAEGFWSNRDFTNDGISVNSGDILREVAKRKLAREVLDKVKPPKVKTQVSVGANKTPTQIEYDNELKYFTDNSKESHLNKLKTLKTLLSDNMSYNYEVNQGVGTITSIDEDGNAQIEQQFNLNDQYAVSKVLAKIKYGTNSSMASKLISDITKTQVETTPNVSGDPNAPAPAGFEQGLMTSSNFEIDGKKYSIAGVAEEGKEISVQDAADELRISTTIPQALKDKGLPVTIDNVNMIRDIAKRSRKTIGEIISSIPKVETQTQEVVGTNRKPLP